MRKGFRLEVVRPMWDLSKGKKDWRGLQGGTGGEAFKEGAA